MTAKLIDGKAISAQIRLEIKEQASEFKQTHGRMPGLAVVLVGEDPASASYVRNKHKACEQVGIYAPKYQFDANIKEKELIRLIDELNKNPKIDGILVQLPLPKHINSETIVERIRTDKDVDGFHPYNIGRLAIRMPTLRSCTPYGIMALIDSTGEKYHGREAVIVGASNHVGRPMGLELLLAGCTVTTCHRFTKDLKSHISKADILIVAIGKAGFIPGDWVKAGATVIDVGINRTTDGKLVGDIDHKDLMNKAAWITPVPGGVGPMTVAMLMKNTLQAANDRAQ